MASRGFVPLAAILITIYLDISSVVVTAAAVAWDPKTSRYNSYNLDKGPVFYEAYYPDIRDAYQEKRYFDRNAVLEKSFQVPFKRLAYSAGTADRPVTSNESFVVVNNEEPGEQQKRAESRRYYDTADKTAPFQDEYPSTGIFNGDEKLESTNVEEISKLVRRAISRDLENWNALERYLDRTVNQGPPIAQPAVHSGENRRNKEGNSYSFPVNRQSFDPSKQLNFELLRKLEDARQRPVYFERTDANENARTSTMSISDTQADAPAIGVISDSLPLENIFQPRPQVIRYMFFKKPMPQPTPQLEQVKEAIDNSTPRSYGDNLIREEIADNSRGKQAEENVKVTSIEVSELPRHKTRHHHGEWPKRDWSAHRHRSQTAA
ncbi:uncharacterized protein [Linepithema humile]|uniref:uncharacterized protein n=1 Tax=Linepithema humile TaxID=83485 RepID=UPI0006239673|nr:PREDICTED: uncharacterized protein LOC105674199 [Linepithema humile]